MSKFVVNSHSLRALEHAVLGLAVELENGGQSTGPYGYTPGYNAQTQQTTESYGELNGGDEPLGEFFTAWEASLALIGKNIETLAKQLGSAADEYESNERSLASLEYLLNPNRRAPSAPPQTTTGYGNFMDQYLKEISGR